MGFPPSFSAISLKGDNLCGSCLLTNRTKSSKNGIYSLRKEFAPMGANYFINEKTPIYKEDNNEIIELIPLRVCPFDLNMKAVYEMLS